jgi:hypothetical protein
MISVFLIGPNHFKVTNENKIIMEMSSEQTDEPVLKKFRSK